MVTQKWVRTAQVSSSRDYSFTYEEPEFSRVKIFGVSKEDLIDAQTSTRSEAVLKTTIEREEHETTRKRGPTSSLSPAATRMKKTGSRSRTHVATVWKGRLLSNEVGPIHNGRAPVLPFLLRPSRDGIITQEMSDPHLTDYGYNY